MGKNRVIKSIGKRIGNVALHKILKKNTNKPESKAKLEKEIIEYRLNASEDFSSHNWNEKEIGLIKSNAINRAIFLFKNYYPDVKYKYEEVVIAVNEVFKELIWMEEK